MRELTDIVAAFAALSAEGKPSAVATVVGVEGSAYRRPGARMLIAEDGRTWGGVSGGCLERDVAARGRGVIAAGRSFLCTYDSADDELISRGVSTGCGGTIDVLIQPITANQPGPLKPMTATADDDRERDVIAVVRAGGAWQSAEGISFDAADSSGPVPDALYLLAHDAATSSSGRVSVRQADAWADLFIDRIVPPQRLILVGGGPDVVPVLLIAKTLGWRVSVVAAPPATSVHERFASADKRFVTLADAPLAGVPVTTHDAMIVMTHNLARDAAVLAALPCKPRFLGVLGPRHRSDRLIATLPPTHPASDLVSPVGLDIGARTPEEIALSIMAGVQAALRAATGGPLDVRTLSRQEPQCAP
ncbi:MAG TPA: XdhC family protein [Tepidisphaeraceae bacterium]|jgi:xanthine/CO dehydrogenase XdhC/CoxF family maturation factor